MTSILIVGFDSAWTRKNSGAIVGVIRQANGFYKTLGDPEVANFEKATKIIETWQKDYSPSVTLILIDQPTIVPNSDRRRPVEDIVSSPIGKCYGAVQPANTNRTEMFGATAPIHEFLIRHSKGNGDSPCSIKLANISPDTWVIETYPILTLIANVWLLDDIRINLRLPKYNPTRKTFRLEDWQFVCARTAGFFRQIGIHYLAEWIENVGNTPLPLKKADRKKIQDQLDACICLSVGLHLAAGADCLFVGNMQTGYMVVPYGDQLYQELEDRCVYLKRAPSKWLRKFNIRDTQKMSSSILTYTGKWFDILKPDPSLIDLLDIAGALSKLCRFGGHCRKFYSVAEHSIWAAELMRQRIGTDPVLIRWALLHDASEAYVVDIPRPAKAQLADYIKIEDAIQRTVAKRFYLPWPIPQEVHEVDRDLLSLELRAYMPKQSEHLLPTLPAQGLTIGLRSEPLMPADAERLLLEKAKALGIS